MRRPKLSPICPPGWTPPAGEAVREAIRAAGWSQVGVARALGLGDRTVRQWCSERSAPSWPVWYAVEALLRLGPEEKVMLPQKRT